MAYLLVAICSLFFTPIFAKDYGVHGHTYPIKEEDFFEFLQKKLNSISPETLHSFEKHIRDYYTKSLKEPAPVKGIKLATQYSVSYFDPTVTAKIDIIDHAGNVIVKQGTQYSPLDHVSLTDNLLFVDGDDLQQLDWARSREGKWIFVKGCPLKSEEEQNRPIYFDQFGFLCKKINITTVPTQVSQEGKKLKIESFVLKEGLCTKD